ncbi:MAG: hypothetical protein ACQESG_06980 [Nanobdellota archaeon]
MDVIIQLALARFKGVDKRYVRLEFVVVRDILFADLLYLRESFEWSGLSCL